MTVSRDHPSYLLCIISVVLPCRDNIVRLRKRTILSMVLHGILRVHVILILIHGI